MTDRSNYATLVDSIFGAGTASFDVTDTQSNNVIGALGKPGQFVEFSANFEQRLHRLAASIKSDGTLQKEIHAAINKIVTSEWDGAYAELCALDYFLADALTGPGEVDLDRTLSASETLALEMGMQNANHDMSFPRLGVSMDTKLLSDKVGGLLDGVFKDFRKAKGIEHLTILPSYNHAEDFTTFQTNRQKLLEELTLHVDINTRPSTLVSHVIPGLSYKFGWDAGVLVGVNSYSPFQHAKNHHHLLFGHAKKFSKMEPTVIVFVIFPWPGEKVFPFEDSKQQFFKSFGDYFFTDYLNSSDLAKDFNNKFTSEISASNVTKHLSGIIFLEDNSILAKTPNDLNVNASFIWNPNALYPLVVSPLEACLLARSAIDLKTV
jgi:hypothetical protein